jgi:hypothetical protein
VAVAVPYGAVAGASTRTVSDPAAHDAALRRAVAFVRAQRGSVDVPSLLIFDYQSRRWHLHGLAGFRDFARAIPGATSPENAFVRLFGPTHRASRAALRLTRDTDRLTAYALECRHVPPTPAYARRLRAAITSGGYDATHALLAIGWIDELGCRLPSAAKLRRQAVARVAGELRTATAVTDLSLEQGAFLDYAGAARAIPAAWARRVRAAQRPDGGWAEDPAGTRVGDHDPTRSNWHATGLALWSLLAARSRGTPGTRMVPR